MTTTSRLNNLILNQDWKRIYQTFKNADFKSYDFENLRRVIIAYLRENYPEDFNDYIESSEYMALIDAIAFLGQSLSFRIDLASRENFIELAERKESVLRLARMLAYNPKRNIPAYGVLKFDSISTTENILDNNGRDLAQQTIVWNDPTNPNWADQFITILNSAMADNTEFGRSQGSAVIDGIETEQYRFRTVSADIPIFTFSKSVAGRTMLFELVSTSIVDSQQIYEEDPTPGNQLGFIYRQDGKGAGSQNTGFFMMFKQGSLELADFSIDIPTANEKISIGTENINQDDIWLYSLDSAGNQLDKWTKVPALTGSNIAYNSLASNIRNVYNVITKENDRVDLIFSDGIYGNLPQGNFRTYYRVSNGLSYQIIPSDLRAININVEYINAQGVLNTLTISLSLKYTVDTATESESIDSIRNNAPAIFYTQNRMVTAEDYNLAPLSSSQNILKVRAINRTSSGISRNFEIIDASGKYSKTNVYASDGFIYKKDREIVLSFKFSSRLDILNYIRNHIEPLFSNDSLYNFYLTKYSKILFTDQNTVWNNTTSDINQSTGYFINSIDSSLLKVGIYTANLLKYAQVGAIVKFVPPEGKSFKNGQLVDTDENDFDQKSKIWAKVVKVSGDGTNAGRGVLSTGLGPIIFNDIIPTGSIVDRIVPKFVNDLPQGIEEEITSLMVLGVNFGLRFDISDSSWKIISASNINLIDNFSLSKTGDTTNTNVDSSWTLAFVKEADRYVIRVRLLDLIFGSKQENRFYFDSNEKVYDAQTGIVEKDKVTVLGINKNFDNSLPLKNDLVFEISDTVKFDDGYQSTDEIIIAFSDTDDDGIIDNPESFEDIVGEDNQLNFLFFFETTDQFGEIIFQFIDNSSGDILLRNKESEVNINDAEFTDGRLVYFYNIDENVIKRVDKSTNTFLLESKYFAYVGRDGLRFQYVHNASVDRRIDPSSSNIIDIFILTRSYDTAFRNYLSGATTTEPEPPNNDTLKISFGEKLNLIKTVSDEIIYHPVSYKVLFGQTADESLQATFKVVKNPTKNINDNDLKVKIVSFINLFFDVNNWDFGDTFYLSELITYVINSVAPDISNMIILPKQETQVFGSLFEIKSRSDEIFVSGATVDDIEIVSSINASEIRSNPDQVISST